MIVRICDKCEATDKETTLHQVRVIIESLKINKEIELCDDCTREIAPCINEAISSTVESPTHIVITEKDFT